jgi:hypothetical protein
MAKSHSGGGRTPTQVPVRTGRPAAGVNPGYAAEIGAKLHQQTDRTPMAAAPPYSAVLGNQKALAVGKGGAGADRIVHKSGSQGTHGQPVQGPSRPVRDILSEFGSELSGRGRR